MNAKHREILMRYIESMTSEDVERVLAIPDANHKECSNCFAGYDDNGRLCRRNCFRSPLLMDSHLTIEQWKAMSSYEQTLWSGK